MAPKQTAEEFWRTNLTQHDPAFSRLRRLFRMLPSDPRCKICYSPFRGPGGYLMRLRGRPQSQGNPSICDPCFAEAKNYPGGAEIELSMLFADVRGSTTLAERMSTATFRQVMNQYYAKATGVLVHANAMIGSLAGDEVIGYFYPALAGPGHAAVAIQAGIELLRAIGQHDQEDERLEIGIGVHTGPAFCGIVEGAEGLMDFAVLGDAVNITARLASMAGANEVLISAAAATAAGIDITRLEQRELELRGRSEHVQVWVHQSAMTGPTR